MKKYSSITVNESLGLAKTEKDRFFVHAKERLRVLKENGSYNDSIHGLFQDSFSETSLNQLLEQFYQKNYSGKYETLVEAFNQFTETSTERNQRIDKILQSFNEALVTNPFDHTSHKRLDEAIRLNSEKVIGYLLNEGCHVLKPIDVRRKLDAKLFESADAKQACLEIKDDPNYVLGLAESLSRGIRYTLSNGHVSAESNQKSISFLESLNNIYSIYREGMDLIQTNEMQATQIFDLFIRDRATNYYFSTCNISKTLKEPASFIQLGLRYLDIWMKNHRNRLAYKFEISTFERLEDMINIYEAQHPMLPNQTVYDDNYYTFPKMYQLLDLMLNISQYLRMDLRNLTCKYLTVFRPMLDSYRTDYNRSKTRTGF